MSGLFCWYAASSQLTKVSYLLYYSILYLSYQAGYVQKTLVGIGLFIYRKHSFIQRIIYFLTIYMLALKNIDINSYALQLKLTRKVPFLRVYNLLLIRMLKTSAKKVLSWASKGRYFDIKRASFQSQLSLNSSPNEHQQRFEL